MPQTVDADGLLKLLNNSKAGLAQCYVVCGDEVLLQTESTDAIRSAARKQGYVERNSFVFDGRADWSPVFAASQSVSLFGDKHTIEISLPAGKPGKTGSDALLRIAEMLTSNGAPDSLFIFQLPRLDRSTRNSKWAQAIERTAVWVDVPVIERRALGNWIQVRLARQQQRADRETLEWLCEKVEGNLLAAHQEIAKLSLLYPEGELSLEEVQRAVLNVARYNIFDLRDAMLGGNAERALTILRGLEGEGEALPLVLWAVGDEIRLLARLSQAQAAGHDISAELRRNRVFGNREQLLRQTLQRVPARAWPPALQHAHDVDRIIKGLHPAGRLDDAWEEAARLTLRVALAGQRRPRP
ncbi:DNA polymerase III subunit delta [Paenalcaligenes niemegkensis]|uniref:DNA polymerase III subunit delta n=1 Tax=Paenalcaligenes niemegkensis TaxID=2895469 RepID=UPI001EE7CFF8|nr:DNA polymerase III subunit delta [Paenalcaligenes niemegkensis]MCQ9616851.1 DNA polymerase III subunit delta [Paenalcaligenes niemegkensis]